MKTCDGNIEPKWLRTDEYVSKSFQDSGERNGGCMDENLHGHMPQRKTFENKSRNCARVHLNQTMGGVRVNVINDVRRTRPVRQSSRNMPEYFPRGRFGSQSFVQEREPKTAVNSWLFQDRNPTAHVNPRCHFGFRLVPKWSQNGPLGHPKP